MEVKRIIAALTLVVHIALVPTVVLGTNQILGYQDGLTRANQFTWIPIIGAQSFLLSTYVAFGNGPTCRRLFWFIAGCLGLLLTVVLSYSMLETFPEPKSAVFLSLLRTHSLLFLITPTASGVLMMLLRPWFGEIRHPSSDVSNLQYSLLDIFTIITFVCVATAWFSYVANIFIQSTNANRLADVMPIVPLLQAAVWQSLLVLSVTWLLFSNRYWFFGLGLFLVVAALQVYAVSKNPLWCTAYTWSIVLITLGVFRLGGYRLLGHLPSVTAPTKPALPSPLELIQSL